MKIAEALMLRADMQKKVAIQESNWPAELP
jgi:hypothetical protein